MLLGDDGSSDTPLLTPSGLGLCGVPCCCLAAFFVLDSNFLNSSIRDSRSLQDSHTSTVCSNEAAEESRCEHPQVQHLCSVLEENRQLRITVQQLKDDHRVAVEEQYRRLRELEEENSQQRVVIENQRRALQAEQQQWWWHRLVARDQHSSQQQATTMEAEPQQLDGAQTVRGSEVNEQQRTGLPDEGIASAGQSSLAPVASGSNAHAAAVDEGLLTQLAAHDAGGDDVCSGDECSSQSSGVDVGIDSVSHGLVKDSRSELEGELNIVTGSTCSDNMESFNSTFCRDSGEHVEGTCDESSEADGGSDDSSDAWDPDDNNNNCEPASKRARITSAAGGTTQRCHTRCSNCVWCGAIAAFQGWRCSWRS
ncbi:hypothetical protein JKP88DRAFT_253454 [Tribonema minus]|uniref:Uncharacterized protein n=1 Tax=Tribonema minus TaxID=303371 RepID=A0A835ZA31_9STRA|nr:hypothetical protein JKP88DRAFT_253454 [Tribonema minus]